MGEPGGHTRWRGTNTSLTSAAWLGGERSCLPPRATPPTAGYIPQTFSGCPQGARAWLDSSLLLRSTGLPRRRPASADSASQDPQRPGPRGVHRPQLRPLPGSQARGWGRGPVPRPGREAERGRGPDPTSSPPPLPGLRVRTWWWRQGEGGVSGPEETGSRALGARAGERGALCSLPRGRGRTAARAGRGARPVPPPRAESGPGGGRKRPPPPPRPQCAAPAQARGPPPRRPRGGLLPPSRGSGEGARPRRRRWLRLGWLPPRGREAAVSLAPRHPPPPAANPHPGWGEGDANYPGSGSARPPPPRPGPACTRPRILGLACAARPPGPPPSPGSAGWVTPPPGAGG